MKHKFCLLILLIVNCYNLLAMKPELTKKNSKKSSKKVLATEHKAAKNIQKRDVAQMGGTAQVRKLLNSAAKNGDWRLAQLILQKPGIDINMRDHTGCTALHYAAHNNQLKIVQMLLGLPGIEINAQDLEGNTPLHMAVNGSAPSYTEIMGQPQPIFYLSERESVRELARTPGIQINITNKKGDTPFASVASVSLYKDLAAEHNLVRYFGIKNKYAIFLAICYRDHMLVQKLLGDCFPLLVPNNGKNRSLMHIAAKRGGAMIMHILLQDIDAIMQLNSQDRYGYTPLHLAVKKGQLETVTELMRDYRIDINMKDHSNQTPLQLALIYNKKEIAQTIQENIRQMPIRGTLSVAMVLHPRLGSHSLLRQIGSLPLELIVEYLYPEFFANRKPKFNTFIPSREDLPMQTANIPQK